MLYILAISFSLITLIGLVLWYAGVLTTIWEVLITALGISLNWVFDPKLSVGYIVESLSYRDFWGESEIIETKTHVFAGMELIPIPSDGNDDSDWNMLFRQLNALFTSLPTDTIIHFDNLIGPDDLGARAILKRLEKATEDENLKLIAKSRAYHLTQLIREGKIRNTIVYCFIGRPLKNNPFKPTLKGLFSPDDFIEREYVPLKSTSDEVLRIRSTFLNGYRGLGGEGRLLSTQEVFNSIFRKLNPHLRNSLKPRSVGNLAIENFYEMGKIKIPACEFFADSPREALGLADMEFFKEYFSIEGIPHLVLTMNTLPSESTIGLIEKLTRTSPFTFPINFSVTMQIEDQVKWEKQLSTIHKYLDEDLRHGTDASSRLQKELKINDIEDFRTRIRVANDKICMFGFNLIFSAPTLEELRRRRDAILTFMAGMEGLQLAYEKHLPLNQFLQTLPCEDVKKDIHRKPFLVRAAIGLTPVTGGNPGVDLDETTSIFTRADGGIFRWNPQSRKFASGMGIIVGRTGVGKSGLLNWHRTDALLEGRRAVSIDFDISGESLAHLKNGRVIDFRHGGVGLFDIRPKKGEDIGEDQLDENGIPKARYQEICVLIEKLCLSPSVAMTADLTPRESTFIREKVYQTYQNFRNRIPKMDDFLENFEKCRAEEYDMAQKLIQNLQKFTMNGFLGDLLNTEEEAISPDCPYTIFDFRLVQDDPQLRFVATLMVKMYMMRFLALDKNIKKYFDVDEVKVIAKDPLMADEFSQMFATARKRNCYCLAASQSPNHFLVPGLRDLRENTEVFWILPIADAKSAQEAFKLTDGATQLVETVSRDGVGSNYRDIVLVSPQGTAHLRHRMNPLDSRLFAQRGKAIHTQVDTLAFISDVQRKPNKPGERPVLRKEMIKALNLS